MMPNTVLVALAGNPNAGKTTMFNGLTGARQHVGNYPGITVEKKEGYVLRDDCEFHIVDLPGAYSLTAYTQEELVSRNFLVEERPDVVVHVLNAGTLERNLYLTVQFLELGAPMVLALNMMDEVRKQGMTINTKLLSELIGQPVVETVARTQLGLTRVLDNALEQAEQNRFQKWKPLEISYGPDLDPVLKDMVGLIEEKQFLTDRYPARWIALKYLENDDEIVMQGRKHGELSKELESMSAKVAEHCQVTLDTYPEAIIADYRYGFISAMMKKGVLTRDTMHQRIAVSDRLDHILTHRFVGPLLMICVLFAVYQITFTIGDLPMSWTEDFFGWLAGLGEAWIPEGLLRSLVVSGIIDGVGGVLSFVPLILIIFFQIAFLEDSGYMARIAYMLDRVFRIFGLHGSSVMPFIVSGGIGGGCAVPGVMASRTLRSRREKLATLLTAPFMTCGAKLPVFILLTGLFFPNNEAVALFCITLTGWFFALVVAKILRMTVIRGPSTPFVMELPPYRIPTLQGMLIHTWERTWQYIKKAGTVILAISILLWAAMTFPQQPVAPVAGDAAGTAVSTAQESSRLKGSFAGRAGVALEPISEMAGFDWRTNISLIGGVAAKEIIVSTMATAYSLESGDDAELSLSEQLAKDPEWTVRRGISMILFVLLYAPCFVTVVAIRQEAGSWGWALFSIGFNTLVAFAVATAAFQLGGLI